MNDPTKTRRSNAPADATLIEGDVRDAEAMTGVDVVFHETAMVRVARSIEQVQRCYELNASATVELLEQTRQEDAQVVFASSAAVYGQPT